MLDTVLGSVIRLSALLGRVALRRSSAQVRYGFALACLGVLVVSPGILFWRLVQTAPLPSSAPAVTISAAPKVKAPAIPKEALTEIADAIEGAGVPAKAMGTAASGDRSDWSIYLDAVAVQAPWVWIIGTPLTLFGLGLGIGGTSRLRRQSLMLENGWVANLCFELRRSLRLSRPVVLALNDRVVSPILIGVFKPMILLPPALLAGCSPAQMEIFAPSCRASCAAALCQWPSWAKHS